MKKNNTNVKVRKMKKNRTNAGGKKIKKKIKVMLWQKSEEK